MIDRNEFTPMPRDCGKILKTHRASGACPKCGERYWRITERENGTEYSHRSGAYQADGVAIGTACYVPKEED